MNTLLLQIQIYGYNSELYANASQARGRAHGITALAVFVRVSRTKTPDEREVSANAELDALVGSLQYILHKGDSVSLRSLSISDLVPPMSSIITYDGSLTTPGCEETVTWNILNKPLYISSEQVRDSRSPSDASILRSHESFKIIDPRVRMENIDPFPDGTNAEIEAR